MERDESVPLAFEETGDREQDREVPDGMPLPVARRAAPAAAVIDITGMISDLESSRRPGGDG